MERKIYINLSIIAILTAILTSFLLSFFLLESTDYLENFISFLPATIGLLVILLILLNIVAYFLTKNIMKPINRISQDIENLMRDDSIGSQTSYRELDPLLLTIQEQKYEIEKYIEQLEEMDRYRREATANISHELKTPLTSINGFAELLATGDISPEDTRKFGEIIYREGQRLLNLIDSSLKLSSIEREDPLFEELDIRDIFSQIYPSLKVLGDKEGVSLDLQLEAVRLRANRRMIQDLLYNLIHNAIKYNKPGGWVGVHIWEESNNCLILIRDTGIGIDESQQEKIFNRFYIVEKSRNKGNSGTGLGLSIVKHIVRRHGGKIQLKSSLGEGTEIRVSLPLHKK